MQVRRRAIRILEAIQDGRVAALERELRADFPAGERDEREELLEAVACDLRAALERFRRRRSEHVEGLEVNLELLRHLAGNSLQ